jgi:alkanesulfonate monooxygenase SsuD/methylene tetrahydromethanopterin reductase-like flavin-dependent oxidoreductase (luciferase family)
MNLDPFGIAYGKPYTRLREAAHIIKLLWRASLQEPANFHGEIYRLEGAFLQVRPKQRPHPPLYIGAVGPRMRRLAGEIGDGWVAMANLSPQTLKAHLQEVYAGLEASGREPEDFAVIPTIYTAVSEDYEEAFRQVEPKARGIMALDPQTLRELGLSRVAEEVAVHRLRVDRAQELRRWREVAQAIPRPVVESVVAIGTPDQCIERLEEFLEAGATHLIVCNVAGGEGEEVTYRAYAEKVKPYLEEQYGG